MATEHSSNTTSTPQMRDAEISALADRLHNRADSVVMRDQPQQAADLRAAASIIMTNASLIRRLAHLQGEIARLAQETGDANTADHLRRLLGGQ
jgi:hypothetical protein